MLVRTHVGKQVQVGNRIAYDIYNEAVHYDVLMDSKDPILLYFITIHTDERKW